MPLAPPRRLRLLVLGFLVLGFLTPAPSAAQEGGGRSLHWREVAVQARLDADGRLHVRERQAMVFDGAWNGGEREFDLRLGQQLRLRGLARVDPETGERTPLVRGDLSGIDEFDWTEDETLRWRSRLASDPPFRSREIVYELEYMIWPVLVPAGDGGYRLRHDFAFPDRAGAIERFEVDLKLDPAWAGPAGGRVHEGADALPPGRGYTVTLPLRYAAVGEPAAVPSGAPGWARALVAGGALLVPLLVLLRLRRRARELDRLAPLTPPEEVTPAWLESHLLTYPAEVVGAAWDRAVGKAEVAALLARLVEEGKLASRVETGGKEPVLHLRRVAPPGSFAEHERDLLDGLFFDGGAHTDTASIREHYRKKGFDPASRIREALEARVEMLPGAGRVERAWLPAAGVTLAGAALTAALHGRPGGGLLVVLGLVVAVFVAAVALGSAAALARRVTRLGGPTAGVLLPLLAASLLLALLASGLLEREGGLLFYRPGAPLLLGFLIVLGGLGLLATALSRPAETDERLVFRRRLVSAREFFRHELERPEPRLRDAWFPYLLAFGLGPDVDRWFRAFGVRGTDPAVGAGFAAGGGASGGHPGSAWTGGGPQFGGGSGGGGGWGGAWGAAATGMAAGVSAPDSGGGGGGGASSGGGGGGGW